MLKNHEASLCDYVEASKKETAITFVTETFNGELETFLSKTKHDNYGNMKAKIEDAYNLIKNLRKPSRNARITPDCHEIRPQELE